MNLEKILGILQLAGTAAPAFKALFDEVLSSFSDEDQDRLKDAYARARARSDAAHQGLQDAADDVSG